MTSKEKESLEMYQWIKQTKPYHLTLGEVQSWKEGEKRAVAMFDRNFEEYGDIWECIPQNKVLPAIEFFKHNQAIITYKGHLKWDITYDYGETIEHPVHLSTSSLATNWTCVDVDPRENGLIEIKNEVLKEGMTLPQHKHPMKIPLNKFPAETRVGWRGPMIEWKYLEKLPLVYWKRSE